MLLQKLLDMLFALQSKASSKCQQSLDIDEVDPRSRYCLIVSPSCQLAFDDHMECMNMQLHFARKYTAM